MRIPVFFFLKKGRDTIEGHQCVHFYYAFRYPLHFS